MTSGRVPRLLIDADLLTFAAASAAQEDFEWSEGIWSTWVNHTDALEKLRKDTVHLVEQFLSALSKPDRNACEVVFCLTGPNNFRKDILPSYKAHRGRKPAGYMQFLEEAKKWAADTGFAVYQREGLEADDCLGILGTHQTGKYRNVIWSKDKDLRMIPCEHLDSGKIVPAEEGWDKRHALQTLVGDAADGYKGLPGCGPVAANKIITGGPEAEIWKRVEAAFVKKGYTRADMLVQARVAKICTAEDYDFTNKKVKLWEVEE